MSLQFGGWNRYSARDSVPTASEPPVKPHIT